MVISVDADETIHLSAEPSARVELTNEGSDEEIKARCYATFEAKSPHSPMPEAIPTT